MSNKPYVIFLEGSEEAIQCAYKNRAAHIHHPNFRKGFSQSVLVGVPPREVTSDDLHIVMSHLHDPYDRRLPMLAAIPGNGTLILEYPKNPRAEEMYINPTVYQTVLERVLPNDWNMVIVSGIDKDSISSYIDEVIQCDAVYDVSNWADMGLKLELTTTYQRNADNE